MGDEVLLLPGSASSADFMLRAFGPVIADRPTRVCTDADGDAARLARAVGSEPALVIGVSLGAHAAAIWAASTQSPVPLVLGMPAWTGPAADVAAATAASADAVEEHGVVAVLDALRQQFPDDWIVRELAAAWTDADPNALVRMLRGTSTSRGPTPGELAAIRAPTVVLALEDDPMHPAAVAHHWTNVIASSALARVGRTEPDAGVQILGERARAALEELLSVSR